ncbi:MAG: hypothetical protein HZY79_12220 [Rhodoblastus sp.]|nr:MAG: hypothetical protein HZY79_12220 [Rhodoblastus sp.]
MNDARNLGAKGRKSTSDAGDEVVGLILMLEFRMGSTVRLQRRLDEGGRARGDQVGMPPQRIDGVAVETQFGRRQERIELAFEFCDLRPAPFAFRRQRRRGGRRGDALRAPGEAKRSRRQRQLFGFAQQPIVRDGPAGSTATTPARETASKSRTGKGAICVTSASVRSAAAASDAIFMWPMLPMTPQ